MTSYLTRIELRCGGARIPWVATLASWNAFRWSSEQYTCGKELAKLISHDNWRPAIPTDSFPFHMSLYQTQNPSYPFNCQRFSLLSPKDCSRFQILMPLGEGAGTARIGSPHLVLTERSSSIATNCGPQAVVRGEDAAWL